MTQKGIYISLLLYIAISIAANGQDYKVPTNYKFDKKSDFVNYEKDILECINYVEKTPIKNNKNREKAVTFLTQWITGTPTFSITLTPKIISFMDSPELLSAFMGGWTKLVLEHPELKNEVEKCNYAGLLSVINVYTLNKELNRDKGVEKFIKLEKKGELMEWVTSQLKK